MTESEAEVINTKKRAKDPEQATEDVPAYDDSEQQSDNPFRSNDKPLKKKFKKSVTKATENGATNIVENEEDQVVSIEGQLTTKPVLSKRQKKKLRKLQHTDRSKDKEAEKVIAYLVKWNEDRDEWKYEKLKQIFIQKNVYDGDIITDEHSDIAINYLTTSKKPELFNFADQRTLTVPYQSNGEYSFCLIKQSGEKLWYGFRMGAARSNIVQRAEEIIRKIEDKLTDENQQELTASSSYKRAREILQLMQE